MDVSNVSQTSSSSSSVATTVATTGTVRTQKSAAVGNALPDAGQVRARSTAQPDAEVTSLQLKDLAASPQPDSKDLQNLVEQANHSLQSRSSDLKFTVAEGTDISVVRVEDKETGEVIRQFPTEAMVAIARALGEPQQGAILEEEA